MNSFYAILRLTAMAALALIISTGCSDEDNPAGNGGEEHEEAFGTMLIVDSDTLVTVIGTNVEGSLALTTSDTLGPIHVWFMAEDTTWFQPEHDHEDPLDDHEELELEIVVADTNLVSILTGGIEWAFWAIGENSGATTLRVAILHEGHEDYVSPEIAVAVAP